VDALWEDAVRRGAMDELRDLLGRGIAVDARNRHGQTGLMIAAHAGHHDVVRLLIAHGADLNASAKYGLTPLMLAVVTGHPDVARTIAGAGADLAREGTGAPGFAKTAHAMAVERGMADLAMVLKPA
jgi:ankyrin repeat protein